MNGSLFPTERLTIQPANKFHLGSGADGKHYWLTPDDLMARLHAEHHFTFDACPYPKPDGFDGLTCEWGESTYVNPPFGSIIVDGKKKGPTAWARKAITEAAKGKRVVLVYPVDKWILMLLAADATVTNLGDVQWCATEDGSPGNGTGRHIACFVLDGTHDDSLERDVARLRGLCREADEQRARANQLNPRSSDARRYQNTLDRVLAAIA